MLEVRESSNINNDISNFSLVPPSSKENLVKKYAKETEASSVDDYNGCKHKYCDEGFSLSRFAVDGYLERCFVSLTEHSHWFVVHLYHYHPISLIHVNKGDRSQEITMVLIGNGWCKLYYCNEVYHKTKTKQNNSSVIWSRFVRLD